MTRLLLQGYKSVKRQWPLYELDTSTGLVVTQWFASQKEWGNVGTRCGMGDLRRIGKWGSQREVFVALFALGGTLHLWLDGQDIDLGSHDVVVKRRTDFLLRKHFTVEVDKRVVFECRYSYLDYEDFPDQDIFWAMTRNLADSEHRCRTLLVLEDKANGVDQSTQDYFNTLEDRIKGARIDFA